MMTDGQSIYETPAVRQGPEIELPLTSLLYRTELDLCDVLAERVEGDRVAVLEQDLRLRCRRVVRRIGARTQHRR